MISEAASTCQEQSLDAKAAEARAFRAVVVEFVAMMRREG